MSIHPTYCVTGANSFVGSHIVQKLLQRGYAVHGTVRSTNAESESVRFLMDLPHAKTHLTLFCHADLLSKNDSFTKAFSNCIGVFHCAAPWLSQAKFEDHWNPIGEGTKNVLESVAVTGSVKRVVLTSSAAAVYCTCSKFFNPDKFSYNEADWNSLEEVDHDEKCRKNTGAEKSYFVSKTAAEREAMKWVKEINEKDPNRKLSLICINPSVACGTILSNPSLETLNTSMQLILGLFFGGDQGGTGIVDVDDVAEAHVRAMEIPNAEGRYICSGGSYRYSDLSARLAKLFPDRCFAEEVVDESLIPIFSTEKIKKDLNIHFTPIDETLKKSVDCLIAKNCVM